MYEYIYSFFLFQIFHSVRFNEWLIFKNIEFQHLLHILITIIIVFLWKLFYSLYGCSSWIVLVTRRIRKSFFVYLTNFWCGSIEVPEITFYFLASDSVHTGNLSGRIIIICFCLAVFGNIMIKSGKHNILTGMKSALWKKFLHCPYKRIMNFHPLFGVRRDRKACRN